MTDPNTSQQGPNIPHNGYQTPPHAGSQQTPPYNQQPPYGQQHHNAPPNPNMHQTPEAAVVAFTHSGNQGGLDSFPILKSFQEYLEAERAQARRRMTMVTGFFLLVIVMMVGAFLTIGVLMFRSVSKQNDELRQALKEQPATFQQAPPLVASAVPTTPTVTDPTPAIKAAVEERIGAVSEVTTAMDRRIGEQSQDLDEVREAMLAMSKNNERLENEIRNLTGNLTETLRALQEAQAQANSRVRTAPPPTRPETVVEPVVTTPRENPVVASRMPPATKSVPVSMVPRGQREPIVWRALIPE